MHTRGRRPFLPLIELYLRKVDPMKISPSASTTVRLAVLNESPDQGLQLYRLRKCFVAVQFDRAEKGRIVFLPEGAELFVVGSSRLAGCLEVLCGRQRYN